MGGRLLSVSIKSIMVFRVIRKAFTIVVLEINERIDASAATPILKDVPFGAPKADLGLPEVAAREMREEERDGGVVRVVGRNPESTGQVHQWIRLSY